MTIAPCKHDKGEPGKLDHLVEDLLKAQIGLGKGLLELIGVGACAARDQLGKARWPASNSCCDIPQACWMPKPLGEIVCQMRPGDTGQVKLTVTNGDYRPHNATVQIAGTDAGLVSVAPSVAPLGPKECAHFTATFTAPEKPGTHEVVLWVSVCSDFYLRWTVEVGEKSGPCCYQVSVNDTPDYTVHWYDHFYCQKPCLGTHGPRK